MSLHSLCIQPESLFISISKISIVRFHVYPILALYKNCISSIKQIEDVPTLLSASLSAVIHVKDSMGKCAQIHVWCRCPENCSQWWKKKNHLKCLLLSSTLTLLGVDNYFASLAHCVYFISCYYVLLLLFLQFGKSSLFFHLTDGLPKSG